MTYKHDYAAFREAVLQADFMVEEMARRGEKVKAIAEQTAPYDPESTDGDHYRESFELRTTREGGLRHNRAEAMVVNTDPAAFVIEMGTVRTTKDGRTVRTPKHRTLGRALDAAGD